MGSSHTKDQVKNTPFCQTLYSSSIANDPDNNDPRIILWVLSLVGAFIVLFFWLWIRRRDKQFESGNVDQANKSFLYIYKFLIYIYISLVAVQTVLMTLEVSLIYAKVQYSNFFISLIQSLILTIPHFQMALIAFLFTKNTLSTKAFTRALKIAIPYALLTFIVCLLDERQWLSNVSNDDISTSAILRVVIDLMFECACMFIVCRQCQYSWKRKNVILRYLLVVMIITGFGFVAQIFQSGKTDGNCIAQIGFYAWYIIYPLVFFKTIQDDSDYHWVYASKPLIESTAKSIADLDLFSLPGYHGVHFESTEDKKFRFKKLKQMVSGYVPIIPFTKIKFENNDEDTRSTISSNSSPSRSSKSSKNNGHAPNAPNGGGTKRDNQTIGAGSTSKVYRGMYKQQPVAVKCLSRLDKKTDMSWTDLTLIFRESILSSSLSHPNVVKFLGASLTYNGFFLVYEYCAYGDLQQILVEHSHPEEPKLSSIPQRLFYLLDIAEGMKFLHKSGFVHRDLKTANVVVNYSKKNKRFVGKICDFGVSRQLPQEQEERMSRNAMAHDRFNKSLSTTYSDVGSFADDNSTVLSVGNGSNLTVNSNGVQSVNTVGSGYGIQTFTPSQAGVGATTLLHGNNHNLNANALSEKHKQWQKFATRGNTKEITRTIHVGTPAFLAPEILLKLVKSKGVDLEKERKKQKKRERKKMQEKLKRRKERERKRKEKESKENKGDIESTSIQKAVGRTLNDIDEEKENVNNAEENLSDDDDDGITSAPHHYVRGAILDHNIDPHIYCDFSTDVYSFGMILWSIVTSKLPYKGFKPMDMILMIKNAQRLSVSDKEWKKWGTCREIDIDVEKLQDLLEQCWAQYPYQRPSFEQIGEILTNIITDSHRKHSDLPKMVIDPESLMTNNTSINNSNIIDRHRHDTT